MASIHEIKNSKKSRDTAPLSFYLGIFGHIFSMIFRQNECSLCTVLLQKFTLYSITTVSAIFLYLEYIVYNYILYSIVVFTQQKESSGKCLICISIEQLIDNMYTQVAIHSFAIGSLAASQFSPSSC